MQSFRDWLAQVEERMAAEVATSSGGGSTSTADIAGNRYGAGITYTDPERKKRVDKMNGGRSPACSKDNGKCGLGGDGKVMMKFNKPTLHDTN